MVDKKKVVISHATSYSMGGKILVALGAWLQYVQQVALCLQAGWSTPEGQPNPSS
jgi:hypothetical protein